MSKNFGVLLVEDDIVDVMNVKRAFKKNAIDYSLFVAKNGIDALNLLRGIEVPKPEPFPMVILLDLNMPKMGGLEFLQEMRKDPVLKYMLVFVMSTSKHKTDVIAAYDLNVAGYIMKPLSFEKFVSAISTLDSYWSLIEYVK